MASDSPGVSRRNAIAGLSMAGGLAASYGAFGAITARFLYPATDSPRSWLFVADVRGFDSGTSRTYRSPAGETIAIARTGETGDVSDFLALSSVCPHLGCQVHWEPQNKRFFCPCHNGAFDATGRATEGPPKDAGQSLSPYPLKIEKGLLYIEVSTTSLVQANDNPHRDRSPVGLEEIPLPDHRGPGHDPCLAPRSSQARIA